MANEKLMIEPAPPPMIPMRKMTSRTTNVDTEVLIVRFKVLLTDWLNRS